MSKESTSLQINPYLVFAGTCREAFDLYEKCLGGRIEMIQTHGESAMADHVSPEWRDKIIHARMRVGDNILMGSDGPPERYQVPQGIAVSLQLKDPAEADRIFNDLSAGGRVDMPIQETFWAARFAMFTDRFGIPWMVNCEQPASA
jgi:PhnB protein